MTVKFVKSSVSSTFKHENAVSKAQSFRVGGGASLFSTFPDIFKQKMSELAFVQKAT